MYCEPDTVWGRTVDGDREIDWPTSELSPVQRQMLADLGEPRTFAQIAMQYRVEAPRFEQELTGLAEARLIAFQTPNVGPSHAFPFPQAAPPIAPATDARAWKPGPAAYAIATSLGFLAVLIVLA